MVVAFEQQPHSRLVGIEVVGRSAAVRFAATVVVAAFAAVAAVAAVGIGELKDTEAAVGTDIALGSGFQEEFPALTPRSVLSALAWWWAPC